MIETTASAELWSVRIFDVKMVFNNGFVTEEVGSLDRRPDIHEHLEFENRTFVVCYIDVQNRHCGVHEIHDFDGYHENTDNLVCPHCGYEDSDAWELSDDDGEQDCGRCGRPFKYERHYEITYSTAKIGGDEV